MSGTKYTSDNRSNQVTINGKGPFIATVIRLNEQVDEGSTLVVDLATDKKLDEKDLCQKIKIEHKITDKEKTTYYAISRQISFCGTDKAKSLYYYQVVGTDALSFLKNTTESFIYQKKTTKEIINDVLSKAGLTKYVKFSVSGDGANREFCVRFNETGYDFVKRLCSEEGWHLHCEHDSDALLVIADTNQAFKNFKNTNISYLNPTSDVSDVLSEWEDTHNIGLSSAGLIGFSFENAKTFDNTDKSSVSSAITMSSFSYGIGAKDKSEISKITKSIISGEDTFKHVYRGKSRVEQLYCGQKFTLKNHSDDSCNQEYIIIGISLKIEATESAKDDIYSNEFICIPSKTEYKPKYITAPTYSGILTATVTGPSDKEVYTDDKGRIKVLIHFDKDAKADENSSIWVPVAQSVACNGFGTMFLPRIGSTVIISFINGNICQPLVISSIYTDNQKLPFSKSSQSGIKTHSHPNGEQTSSNELRFDDQKDAEEVYLHAQKDLVSEIENDVKTTIKGNKEVNIEKKLTTTAKEEISHSGEKSYAIACKENYSMSTDADSKTTVKGKATLTVDKDISETTKANYALKADKNVTVDGDKITITGKSNITLKVGSSKIEITSSGITINATNITLKGTTTKIDSTNLTEKGSANVKVEGANITVKANAQAKISGLTAEMKASTMATVEGNAMLTLKGGLTRIN